MDQLERFLWIELMRNYLTMPFGIKFIGVKKSIMNLVVARWPLRKFAKGILHLAGYKVYLRLLGMGGSSYVLCTDGVNGGHPVWCPPLAS